MLSQTFSKFIVLSLCAQAFCTAAYASQPQKYHMTASQKAVLMGPVYLPENFSKNYVHTSTTASSVNALNAMSPIGSSSNKSKIQYGTSSVDMPNAGTAPSTSYENYMRPIWIVSVPVN